MATLDLIGLRKSFGDTQVLRQIDLSLADGEMLVIVGASGCGKSTLPRIVAGLETPSAGSISLDGKTITGLDPAARDISMVFQNYALYPHFSVFDNMAYGLRIRGLAKSDIARRVDEADRLLGLTARLTANGTAARLDAGPVVTFSDGTRPGAEGRALTLGIRPEHLTAGVMQLSIQVDLIEPLGSETLVHGHLSTPDATQMVVKVAGRAPAGEILPVAIQSQHLHVFDRATGARIYSAATAS